MVQQDKKAQAEQRAIQAAHSSISKALGAAQRSWAEEEHEALERCTREQGALKERLSGAASHRSSPHACRSAISQRCCVRALHPLAFTNHCSRFTPLQTQQRCRVTSDLRDGMQGSNMR